MKTINIRELRASLGRLDELIERHGELAVTRRGKVIARVVPLGGRRAMPSHAELRSALPRLSSSAVLIREERDRG